MAEKEEKTASAADPSLSTAVNDSAESQPDASTETTATTTDEADVPVHPDPNKVYKRRKQLPSVPYLLAHGDPEKAKEPWSFWHAIKGPLTLVVIFYVSLELFLRFAPRTPREKYRLPKMSNREFRHEPPTNTQSSHRKADSSEL
jgi:hypothetical protein